MDATESGNPLLEFCTAGSGEGDDEEIRRLNTLAEQPENSLFYRTGLTSSRSRNEAYLGTMGLRRSPLVLLGGCSLCLSDCH